MVWGLLVAASVGFGPGGTTGAAVSEASFGPCVSSCALGCKLCVSLVKDSHGGDEHVHVEIFEENGEGTVRLFFIGSVSAAQECSEGTENFIDLVRDVEVLQWQDFNPKEGLVFALVSRANIGYRLVSQGTFMKNVWVLKVVATFGQYPIDDSS